MKTLNRFIISIMVVLVLSACSSGLKINKDSNGKTISMPTGQTLEIQLEGNITTGYEWQIISVEETILKPNGEPKYNSDSKLAGAGGEFIFKFDAKNPGEAHLKLGYLRPWEENTEPIETFEITVMVK